MLEALVQSSKVHVKYKMYHILGVKVANSPGNEEQYGSVLLKRDENQSLQNGL